MESKIPGHLSVKTFRPTCDQFICFGEYLRKLELTEFAAKIIPPPECVVQSKSLNENQKLKNVVLQKASNIESKIYNLSFDEKKEMTLHDFKNEATQLQNRLGQLTIKEFEDSYWNNLASRVKKRSFVPKYAIDNDMSLFPNHGNWNLSKLTYKESLIHSRGTKYMPGIHKPFVYIGGPLTSFAFHVEDGDLGSINYNHEGYPKIWYVVPEPESRKLEDLVKKFTSSFCERYIRHKSTLAPPSVLREYGVNFARIVQYPGEYVVLFPGAYHSGFNCGLNFAESVNFGSSRWLDVFPKFKICQCAYSKVSKAVQGILQKIHKREMKKKRSNEARIPNSSTNEKNAARFKCSDCNVKFSWKKNLLCHKRMFHAKKVVFFKCNHCGKSFSTMSNLRSHCNEKHHNLEPPTKDACQKSVNNSKKVQRQRIANKGKVKRPKKMCTLCKKSFSGVFNLKRHIGRSHPAHWKKNLLIDFLTNEKT